MKPPRALRGWVLWATAVLLLAGCDAAGQPASTAPVTEVAGPAATAGVDAGTLRVGTTYIWDSPNPAVGRYNYALRYLLYDTLVEETGIGDVQPGLAESWSTADGGRVWTFKIRGGVRFHDGTPLTAEDVAWSLNWAIDNEVETFKPYLADFQEVVALDATTVQITLSRPAGNMEYRLMYVWIVPRSVWEGRTGEDMVQLDDLAAATGSGPYRLAEWVEGEYLALEANEKYWRGAPDIDRVVWQEFASDEAVVEALTEGEIDVAYRVPRTAAPMLAEAEDVELAVMPSTVVDELILNSHEKGTQPKSLNDPAVRLAIAHAIDKQQIVDAAYLGYAHPASTIIPASMGDWHNDAMQDIPFDPAEGNLILEEAGYLDQDGDGVREDKEGKRLEYRLYAEDDETAARSLEIVVDGLAQIGILATPARMDHDRLVRLYPSFDFDLLLWGWSLDPDPGLAMRVFACDQRQKGGWNDSGYCNAEFDKLIAQQAATVDRQARRDLIWQMQARLFEDRPYVMLVYEDGLQAYRSDRFRGFKPDAGDILWKSSLLGAREVE